MRLKHLQILIITIIALAGCARDQHKFTITGQIKGMPEQTVQLEELGINEITIIDSVRTDNGQFELSGTAPEPGLYRLSFDNNQYIILSISGGTLKVNGDWHTLYDYTITGSPASESLRNFLRTVREYARDINTISGVVRTMQERGNDSLLEAAYKDMKDINFQLTRFIEHYADTTSDLPAALFAVQILNPGSERVYLETFVQTLDRRFANARLAKDFTVKLNRMLAQPQMPKRHKRLIPDGPDPEAPDFSLPTPAGATVSLSSFKGKYVLLDFWASWCAPCRAENPNVVAAYHKFKNKNFTILGVSLDQKKEAWQKAIEDDGLTWTHVSDLRGWSSPAAQIYQVESIPANFLIDPDGKIIACNLRGAALASRLQEVLK